MPNEFGRHSRDEILARLRELDEMGDRARIIELERRVLVLTAALTDIADEVQVGMLGTPHGPLRDRSERLCMAARAALSAAPTESEAP